jgi:uncharacterized membrane protein HdeD (DUF308 family)
VTQTAIKSWYLLALCAVFDALLALIVFTLGSPEDVPILRTFLRGRTAPELLGMLALAAGACALAAGLLRARKLSSWPLILNGVASCLLGLIMFSAAARAVTFRSIALLIAVMAFSIAIYLLAAARNRRTHLAQEWVMAAPGIVFLGFAVEFLGFALRWIPLEPSPSAQTFDWLASYFAVSAIGMMGLALRDRKPPAAAHFLPRRPLPSA